MPYVPRYDYAKIPPSSSISTHTYGIYDHKLGDKKNRVAETADIAFAALICKLLNDYSDA